MLTWNSLKQAVLIPFVCASMRQTSAKDIDLPFLETEEFKKRAASLRGSIMIVGPLLARFGKTEVAVPFQRDKHYPHLHA